MGPTLSGCTGLQELYLYTPSIEVSAFEGLTGLRILHLVADSVFEGAATGVAAVFEHIGRMQHLERLVVATGFLGDTVTLGADDAELCGGLTASMHLTHLDLRGLQLPRSAWMHLFPLGRQLPQLRSSLGMPDFRLQFVDGVLLDGCALAQMVSCFPAFSRLTSECMSLFRPDVSLVPLLQLRQLVDLECHSVGDGDASLGVLACLSSLSRLHVRAAEDLTHGGLLQLTALTGLQELTVKAGDARWNLDFTICKYGMELKTTCVSDPDVWYQLLLACVPAPQCQALLNQHLPRIMQQLQDSDYGTTTFELAREVGRVMAHRARVQAEYIAAMLRENDAIAQAQQQLQKQLKATGVPCRVLYEAHDCGEYSESG